MGGSHSKYSNILAFCMYGLLCYIFIVLVSKHLFKVSCSMPEISRHSHTLQACSDYNKKAWMDAFSLARSQFQQLPQFHNTPLEPVIEQSQSSTIL